MPEKLKIYLDQMFGIEVAAALLLRRPSSFSFSTSKTMTGLQVERVDDLTDAPRMYADVFCQPALVNPPWLEKFFRQNLAALFRDLISPEPGLAD